MRRIALFDLDNTLIDRQAAFRQWAAAFLDGGTSMRAMSSGSSMPTSTAMPLGPTSSPKLRARYRLPQTVEELLSEYERDYPAFFEPDPAVGGALEQLRSAGWRIAIVTNGPATQHVKMARAGSCELVDACCVSEELGSWKPDHRIFEHAVAACGA